MKIPFLTIFEFFVLFFHYFGFLFNFSLVVLSGYGYARAGVFMKAGRVCCILDHPHQQYRI